MQPSISSMKSRLNALKIFYKNKLLKRKCSNCVGETTVKNKNKCLQSIASQLFSSFSRYLESSQTETQK